MNSYTANFSEFSIKVLTVNLIRLTWKSIKSKCRYIGILSTNACRSSWRWRQTGWGNYNKKNRYTKKWNISDVTEEYFCYQIWHEIWSSAGVKNTQISPAKVGHQSPRNTSNQDILHYCNTPKLLLRLQGLKPLSFFLKKYSNLKTIQVTILWKYRKSWTLNGNGFNGCMSNTLPACGVLSDVLIPY